MEKYDIIIAGASFAGLAVASKIKGNVLLIDRNEIGTYQISACGTTVETLKNVGCEESILQTFDTGAIHTKNREIHIPLVEEFCTFDYKKFCKLFAKQNKAKFLKANIKGVENSIVTTNKGSFKGKIVVDCSGWEAVLASSLRKNYVKKNMVSFGIETEIPFKDNKLRFFINDEIIKNGAAWLFPCNNTTRFGLASYVGNTHILDNLKRFLDSYNLKVGRVHGGYLCYCLKDPIVENIFVVGCAAGQTLPLTGEGIRRSVYFGLKCGIIIQKILDNKISLKQGQKEYRDLALKNKKYYNWFLWAQNKFLTIPNWKINFIARILSFKPIAKYALNKYLKI